MDPLDDLIVRPATPADASGWLRLRQALWPDCPAERHALEMALPGVAEGAVLLAEGVGGTLVGFAEVSVRREHVEGTTAAPVAYLEGWYVDAPWRGRGVGRRLVTAVERWAAAQGFRELASDAELHQPGAIAAHGRLGFVETGRSVHFVKSLAPATI